MISKMGILGTGSPHGHLVGHIPRKRHVRTAREDASTEVALAHRQRDPASAVEPHAAAQSELGDAPPPRVSHRPRFLGSLRNAHNISAGPVVIGEYGGVAVARVTAAEPRLVDAVTAGAMTRSTNAVEREEVARLVHNKHVEQKPGGRV